MATLLTNLPDYGFPHEYNSIRLSGTGLQKVELKSNGATIWTFNLYPGADGVLELNDFAALLRDLTSDFEPRDFTLSWSGGQKAFFVLPCAIDLTITAAEFFQRHFLSLCRGLRTTWDSAVEYVTMYTDKMPGDRDTFEMTLVWVNHHTGETESVTLMEEDLSVEELSPGMYRLAFCPRDFIPPAPDLYLLSIVVSAGKRVQRFIRRPTMVQPASVVFRGAMGQFEAFHFFGSRLMELKPTRSTASFAGRTRNYQVKAVPEFTLTTGVLRPTETPLFEDLCASTLCYLGTLGGPELTITENDLKITGDQYEAETATCTFRHAGRTRLYAPTEPAQTFDDTFDNSFR